MLWMMAASLATIVHAEEPADSPAAAAGEKAPSGETAATFPQNDPEDSEARRRAKQLGVVMLGGIVIIGISLVAFVLIWGNRVRRTARAPLPRVAGRNELWFLKPGKKDGVDEGPPESPAGGDE